MTTTAAPAPPTDSLGTEVRIGDRVLINAWGAPVRLADTGRTAIVVGITRTGNLTLDVGPVGGNTLDPIAGGRSVRPGCVGVLRRDGSAGYEGNR